MIGSVFIVFGLFGGRSSVGLNIMFRLLVDILFFLNCVVILGIV